ncbi:hypothetical protein GHT06_015233 [Daphnia sinensis]|uniref:Uncharacterized protein n=1 Tax=Daphnia sinensis TaxID=1820382 RepID=A0AAD5KQY8_9CRUS|nr:hypothetical protein GHT06_015233 [Daphnia sinensis]
MFLGTHRLRSEKLVKSTSLNFSESATNSRTVETPLCSSTLVKGSIIVSSFPGTLDVNSISTTTDERKCIHAFYSGNHIGCLKLFSAIIPIGMSQR